MYFINCERELNLTTTTSISGRRAYVVAWFAHQKRYQLYQLYTAHVFRRLFCIQLSEYQVNQSVCWFGVSVRLFVCVSVCVK